jgi:hypothetical protein
MADQLHKYAMEYLTAWLIADTVADWGNVRQNGGGMSADVRTDVSSADRVEVESTICIFCFSNS